jgi:hypothetical protein
VELERLGDWAYADLPRLNRAILAAELPAHALIDALDRSVLATLPDPESLDVRQAKQALVLLSFCGASVARHYQGGNRERAATPDRAFASLAVGPRRIPFRDYFTRLADQSGTGHPSRDSYASLVRWNVPTVAVCWAGERIAVLPGVFDDGRVRTYTGHEGERLFFELIKKSEAVELAVNGLLQPMSDRLVGLESEDAVDRVLAATTLLNALRQLTADFIALPARRGMPPDHFVDVFRQFAARWSVGDIPPSGALDPESLKRDLLLGLDIPGRDQHVLRLFPALLSVERAELTRLMHRPTLPEALLASLRLDPAALREMPAGELRATLRRHPALAAWYLLLSAHARASGLHLAAAKKFLFRTARERDLAGIPDTGIVPRKYGTTGMDESLLERLARVRHNHVLANLQHIPRLELIALAGVAEPEHVSSEDVQSLVTVSLPATEGVRGRRARTRAAAAGRQGAAASRW